MVFFFLLCVFSFTNVKDKKEGTYKRKKKKLVFFLPFSKGEDFFFPYIMSFSFSSIFLSSFSSRKKGNRRFSPTSICAASSTSETPYFDRSFDKGRLKDLIRWTFENHGAPAAVDLVERLKNLGFRSAAAAGVSLGVEDLRIPKEKRRSTKITEGTVRFTEVRTNRGAATLSERAQSRVEAWARASESRKVAIVETFRSEDPLSPLYLRAFSGARGNRTQVRQLIGRRGLRVDPLGRLVEFPIRSNFKEGRTLTEFLISCYGARKGIVDTALRTATAGYLTRRLVDVAHYQVIGRLDCGTRRAIRVTPLRAENGKILVPIAERLVGRALARSRPGVGARNSFLTPELAEQAVRLQGESPWVRSPLACRAGRLGPRPDRFVRQRYLRVDVRDPAPRLRGFTLCQRCYGWSLADAGLVHLGEAVGILAAQSIGEPGTQLTRRTFHTGGVFSGGGATVLRTPVTGKIHFLTSLRGRLARTRTGRIGYLTREPGQLAILDNHGKELTNVSLPTNVLLFVREGQLVHEGIILGERSPPRSLREGELILRVTRSPHGGQLNFQRRSLKEPKKEPRRRRNGERVSRPGWASNPRTEGLSRLRLLAGERVETSVRNQVDGSFPFLQGDVVAPLTSWASLSRRAPSQGWQAQAGKTYQTSFLAQLGGRQSYSKQSYSFTLQRDAWKKKILGPCWKTFSTIYWKGEVHSHLLEKETNLLHETQLGWSFAFFPKLNKELKKQPLTSVCLPPLSKAVSSFLFSPTTEKKETQNQKEGNPRLRKRKPGKPVGAKRLRAKAKRHERIQKGGSSVSKASFRMTVTPVVVGSSVPTAPILSRRRTSFLFNKQNRTWQLSFPLFSLSILPKGALLSISSQEPREGRPRLLNQGKEKGYVKPMFLLQSKKRLQTLSPNVSPNLPSLRWPAVAFEPLRPDSQGFGLRGKWKPRRTGSAQRGHLQNLTTDWGERAGEQKRPFSTKRLFRGRPNLGAIALLPGASTAPLGSYCTPPLHIRGGAGPCWSGQFISLTRKAAVFRRTTDFLLSPESRVRGKAGTLLPRHWPRTALRGRAVETGDITSGIPRVESLLEAREKTGIAPFTRGLYDRFCRLGRTPRVAVRKSLHAAQRAILENVQRIYRTNGVVIDDKHVELIVRPRAYVEVVRDGAWHEPLARGEVHPLEVLERANQLRALFNLSKGTTSKRLFGTQDLYPRIEYTPILLGLTRASLLTTSESFLSAASFQETSRVLARAGVRGRIDYLLGLKENLILGTRLPIGTAARHLLLLPSKPSVGDLTKEKKEALPSTSRSGPLEPRREEIGWKDQPRFTKDPTWLDALVYLGENGDPRDPRLG